MDLSGLPKNPTYALYRYIDAAVRLVRTSAALLNSVKPIVDGSPTNEIFDPDVIAVTRMTAEFSFQRVVDNFQTYLVDILAEIFSTKPEMIPSGEIDRRMIFRNHDLTRIRIEAVDNLLRSFSYKNAGDMSEWLERNFSFPLLSKYDDRKFIKNCIDVRNSLTHNRGMVDYRYRDGFSEGGRSQGKRIDVPDSLNTLEKLTSIAADIDKRAAKKFDLERVPSADV